MLSKYSTGCLVLFGLSFIIQVVVGVLTFEQMNQSEEKPWASECFYDFHVIMDS